MRGRHTHVVWFDRRFIIPSSRMARDMRYQSSKLSFAKTTVTFAGFEITPTMVRPFSQYLEAIQDFPAPRNITDVRSWFGLINQVSSYAFASTEHMKPFHMLLKPGNPFQWTDELNHIFEESKAIIVNEIHKGVEIFDKTKLTCLATDCSKDGIGFWLFQKTLRLPTHQALLLQDRLEDYTGEYSLHLRGRIPLCSSGGGSTRSSGRTWHGPTLCTGMFKPHHRGGPQAPPKDIWWPFTWHPQPKASQPKRNVTPLLFSDGTHPTSSSCSCRRPIQTPSGKCRSPETARWHDTYYHASWLSTT